MELDTKCSKREDCKLNLEEAICSESFDHCCPTIKEALDFIQKRCSEHCGMPLPDCPKVKDINE